jgi:membrane protease YdiL (CAAX protease family)
MEPMKANSRRARPRTPATPAPDGTRAAVLVAPLFLTYQLGVLTTGGVKNGADFVTRFLWMLCGGNLWLYVGVQLVLLGGLLFSAWPKLRAVDRSVWGQLLLESALFSFLLAVALQALMRIFSLAPGLALGSGASVHARVVLSLGAGLYEEIVFRALLLSGLLLLGVRALGWSRRVSLFFAVLVSSLLFSAVHYVGPLGDVFSWYSFLYRGFAGVFFALLFLRRGFAVAAYTHAFYDVLVLVLLV